MALIKDVRDFDDSVFSDIYLVMARRIEESLVEAGAIGGEDYSIMDCYKLAQPFVLQFIEKKQGSVRY